MNNTEKVPPSFWGLNTLEPFNLRNRGRAAKVTEELLTILVERGPIVISDLWHVLDDPYWLSREQIRHSLNKAKNVRAKAVFYGIGEVMYGLEGDPRWESAEQAYLADRRKTHSNRAKAWHMRKRIAEATTLRVESGEAR
jgi:hypothetical protein